jgi:anthranilate phosphoribosyltransferase
LAFLIAHRIKRPTGTEIAGFLDAYKRLGGQVAPINSTLPVIVLGSPYDGRDRTAPISPLTALILATAGSPVLLHGGDRMPTKEGVPLIEVWQSLGIDWRGLSLAAIHQILSQTNLGFVYLPDHFGLAQGLVPYREQIGKRPPLATLELIWAPYAGSCHVVSGFVHPPTELAIQEASALHNRQTYTTVKGMEGSCDLPRDRTAIIGLGNGLGSDRLILPARDYGFAGGDVPFQDLDQLSQQMLEVLAGKSTELGRSAIWNGGFYLWRSGRCENLESGFALAEQLLTQGKVFEKLLEIRELVSDLKQESSPIPTI